MDLLRKLLFSAYLKINGVSEFPKFVSIETTNICNLNCVMCPRRYMKRAIGVMDFELFKKIIDELSTKNINEIELHLFGEPLTKSEMLFKAIGYAQKRMPNTDLSFSENALLLNEENAKKILLSGLTKITFSLDGATKETYEKLRLNSDFDIVMQNVENFMRLKKELNPRLRVILQIIKMNETEKEIDAFKHRWTPFLGKYDIILVKEFTTWGGQVENKSIDSLKRKITRYIRNSFPCRALWETLNIHWNGDVVACCLDVDAKLKVGNCREQTITEIINGKKMQELRRLHLEGNIKQISMCKDCYAS